MNFVYETDRLILKICGEEISEDVLVFDLHNTKEFEAVEPIDVDNFYNIEHHRNILNYEYKKMLQLAKLDSSYIVKKIQILLSVQSALETLQNLYILPAR